MIPKHRFRPKSRGLGIQDWFKSIIAARPSRMFATQAVFKLLVKIAPLTHLPVVGELIKRATLTSPDTCATQGYSIPLNIDVAKSIRPVTLPVELMKKAVRESKYRAAMNSCVCRDAFACSTYPHDLACIFVGKGAKICVDNGIAHEATVEECLARIDKAASLGLSGQAYWMEVEAYVWGFKNEDMEKFLEFCFCCTCCCSAMQFSRKADRPSRTRYHRSIGWVATVNEKCVNCGSCVDVCPEQAITRNTTSIHINEDCGGCGVCLQQCKSGALQLSQKSPLKADLKEYFEGLSLDL
jgi:Pyruvate/2-oxoacid:ferredoxin oxidoreductase delta subunit